MQLNNQSKTFYHPLKPDVNKQGRIQKNFSGVDFFFQHKNFCCENHKTMVVSLITYIINSRKSGENYNNKKFTKADV